MSELIERLRHKDALYQTPSILDEAADEIERLTAQRNELLAALKVFDALIEHQYSGTREAMSALQHAANVAQEAIAKVK